MADMKLFRVELTKTATGMITIMAESEQAIDDYFDDLTGYEMEEWLDASSVEVYTRPAGQTHGEAEYYIVERQDQLECLEPREYVQWAKSQQPVEPAAFFEDKHTIAMEL